MSIKLYNKKTGHTAACERADWTECRDHNSSKGWVIYTPEHLNTPERKAYLAAIDNVLDNGGGTVTASDYASIDDSPEEFPNYPMSKEYNERAAALREKNFKDIREQGIGSNFKVLDPEDGYEKNDRLWFGTCEECGERVTNSSLKGVWEHTVILEQDKGYTRSRSVSDCPTATAGLGKTAEARANKPKARMTKSERKFFDEVTAIVFATPEVRDGKNYMDRKAFAALPEETQKRWLALSVKKTF